MAVFAFFFPFDALNWLSEIKLIQKGMTEYLQIKSAMKECLEYDVFVDNQMKKTIALLQNKISLLNQIKNEYDVSFFLEVVPMIYTDESTPCLAPSLEIIDFCHATRTEIDIDMYVYDHNDE